MTECDYVIVGAGSAGCVLAARLSEDAGRTVLLAEAGGRDWNPLLHIPLGSGKLLRRGLHGWRYVTEPNPGLGGRRLPWTRGRVLGGSSAINGMVYVRGHPSDYDGWAMRGNEGWSFRDVLPYFRRAEGHRDRSGPDWGTTGPLGIARAKSPNPLYEAFIRAGGDAGYPVSDDIGRGAEGFGRFDFNIVDGRRCSAAQAYLAPVRSRANLAIRTGHQAVRILFEGRRAAGVEFAAHGGKTTVRARREVILSAGTANSPQLLMLSGVGEADHLRAMGIPVVNDLTGVGKNLQDHIDVPVRFAIREALSLHALIRIDRIAAAMIEAVVRRTGPATSFPTEAGAFLRSSPDAEVPDLQIHFSISLGGGRVRVPPFDRLFFANPLEREGFQIRMCVLRPKSRGEIRLASADAFAKPLIVSNCLSDGSDLELLLRGVEIARDVASKPSLARLIDAEIGPGSDVQSREAVERYIRQEAFAIFHPVGTCRMGTDGDAVVDPFLKVRGLDGLRVVDASVMPTITGGNTHGPTIMIAEKAADMIRGRTAAAPERLEAAA